MLQVHEYFIQMFQKSDKKSLSFFEKQQTDKGIKFHKEGIWI